MRGLVLAGGLGRGAQWPLSDIDLIGIFEDSAFELTRERVASTRERLESQWSSEGFWVGLDIKGIVFTVGEVDAAVRAGGADTAALLKDKRFYHGLDKMHGGQVVHDPDGTASALLAWVNKERYTDRVTGARIREKRRLRDAAVLDAQRTLDSGAEVLGACLAVDLAVVANVLLLMEI